MSSIRSCSLPHGALLRKYAGSGYTDCYTTDVDGVVSHADYVMTFYTGRLFRIERGLIGLFLSRPTTDAQTRQLARGEADSFSAWTVEGRAPDQLLLCDIGGRTRSWLMVSPGDGHDTRLYFGSAVVPAKSAPGGKPGMGFLFKALLGFHRFYSRALLHSARSRLAKRPNTLVVESAGIDDAEEILALQHQAYQSEARIYDDDSLPPVVQTLDELRDEFKSKTVLKAVENGKLVGSVRGYAHDGTAFLGRLAVSPSCQGRGVGAKLVHAFEASFPQVRRIELFTGHKSARNLALYQRLGYVPFRTDKVNEGLDLVYLEKVVK